MKWVIVANGEVIGETLCPMLAEAMYEAAQTVESVVTMYQEAVTCH